MADVGVAQFEEAERLKQSHKKAPNTLDNLEENVSKMKLWRPLSCILRGQQDKPPFYILVQI